CDCVYPNARQIPARRRVPFRWVVHDPRLGGRCVRGLPPTLSDGTHPHRDVRQERLARVGLRGTLVRLSRPLARSKTHRRDRPLFRAPRARRTALGHGVMVKPLLRDAAINLAHKGMRIFPCLERAKEPAIADNLRRATTDINMIAGWWQT